jgi:hypothetical protein
MKTFAVIENNIVVNIIVADSIEVAESATGLTCVEYYVPKIGDSYIDGAFVPSNVEEPLE